MTLPPAPASPPIDSVGTAPKPSVIHRVARRFRRPGSIWRSCSAAIASPARSCPLLRYWQTSQIPATPTSITPWQQAHAGDAGLHVRHFPRPFRRPVDADPGVRRARHLPHLKAMDGDRYRRARVCDADSVAHQSTGNDVLALRVVRRPMRHRGSCDAVADVPSFSWHELQVRKQNRGANQSVRGHGARVFRVLGARGAVRLLRRSTTRGDARSRSHRHLLHLAARTAAPNRQGCRAIPCAWSLP
jgi:hypothetical protein